MTRAPSMSMPAVGKPPSARVVNLVLAVDVSSSMAGEKLRAANTAASECLHQIATQPIAERFCNGIVTFDGVARITQPLVRMQAGVSQIVNASLGNGATNIKAAMDAAIDMLEAKANDDRASGLRPVSVICLLSDGCANAGGDPQASADRARASGITVVTIAFGSDADQAQLRRVATTPQHAYSAFDGSALRELFARFGATLSQAAAGGGAIQYALATI